MQSSPKSQTRILLVEDDQTAAALTRRTLNREEYVVAICETVDSAVQALLRERYDLVLLDYSLPGGSPWTVLETAQMLRKPVPVVVVTGMGDERIAVKAIQSGALDYVVKKGEYWTELSV